jgi:mannose-1-phosphate guanylyltransferase
MLKHAYAVIMAGGKGERFWPLSTSARPKQLLSLVGDTPLLAQAVDRIRGLFPIDAIYVITSAALVKATREVVPDLPPANIIGEPCGRDTAAAIAVGAGLIQARDPGAAFCVLTADQVMQDVDLFRETLSESLTLALARDVLITIGIRPTFPSTGFGYIESGATVHQAGRVTFLEGRRFLEKPDGATATRFVDSGRYYWNAGMFIWSLASLRKAFAACRPPLAALMDKVAAAGDGAALDRLMAAEYPGLEKISIDYAVMEKASNIVMAQGLFRWDDVGSWPALEGHFEKDAAGNVLVGDCATLDARDTIVISKGRLTAVLGVKDVIIVQAEGATLVCAKDRAQDLKKLVQHIAATGTHDALL